MTNGTARSQVFVGAGQWTSAKKSGALFRQAAGNDAWEQLTKGLTHHRVSRVLLFGTAEPNVWFDISSTMKTKIHALQAHESQVSDFTGLAQRMHAFAAATGKAWGLEKAEAFRYLELA